MTKDEAIATLEAIKQFGIGKWIFDKEEIEAFDMAIEALSADAVQGVGRYENAMQKLQEMPRYLNGIKEKQITKISNNYTTEKPNDIVEQKNDVVAEPTDLIRRADAIEAMCNDCGADNSDFYPNCGQKEYCAEVQALLALPSAEQKEEDLAEDIARRMATIIENEQDMRVILKNASAEPTDLISRQALCEYALNQKDKAVTPNDIMRFPSASVPTKCIAQINIDADEVVKRIKDEYEIADRPAELLKDGTLKVKTDNGADVKRVLVCGDDGSGGLYYADDRPSGEWVEKEVMVDEDASITEWQSAKCSVCGKYHTTPYMYYFDSFNYCPNCGAKMGGNK